MKGLKIDEDKLFKLARLCLNFLIRYISIKKEKPSQVEKEIGNLARKLRMEGDLSIISSKFQEYAKDSELREALRTLRVNYKSPSTYFILTEYEKKFHNEQWIAPERSAITVEHILPQKPDFSKSSEKNSWASNFTREEYEVYLNRLGNLTLLGPKAQGKAGNKEFKDKKKVYGIDTDMLITHELTSHDEWTKDTIEQRQKLMADKLLEIFTLNIEGIK